MLNKNSKGLIIGVAALVVIGAFVFFLSKGNAAPDEQAPAMATIEQVTPPAPAPSAEPVPPAEEAKPETSLLAPPAAMVGIDVAAAMKDRVLGSENAPVTIIEYASLTCSHCADFTTKILPEIRMSLIETGKARLIFRDFPLDNVALKASMMARCVPADKYFNMIEVLFSNQARWAESKDPLVGLAQLGSLAGLDAEAFKKCTQDTALETAIADGVREAQSKYQIQSTPTFIFNDGAEKLAGARDAAEFVEIVNKLTKGK